MDTSPRDMDFLNTQKEAAKLIASAYGVPLPLIDNDASTFNNLEQAKEKLYTDTILPLFREFLSQFGNWLLPLFGEGLRFQINEDKIGALEGIRTRLFTRMMQAVAVGVLTVDEAREAIGYDPLGDDVQTQDVQRAMSLIGYGRD
jgi:HK97 family phage portal protein